MTSLLSWATLHVFSQVSFPGLCRTVDASFGLFGWRTSTNTYYIYIYIANTSATVYLEPMNATGSLQRILMRDLMKDHLAQHRKKRSTMIYDSKATEQRLFNISLQTSNGIHRLFLSALIGQTSSLLLSTTSD